MENIFTKKYRVPSTAVDRYDRLKASYILSMAQDIAGDHCLKLGTDRASLESRRLFWVVIRQRVKITRLPRATEEITLETWPMPTTRTAYPRATVAYDREGKELFRCVSLWVLMDLDSRTMVVPRKSGVEVLGLLRGTELEAPGSLAALNAGGRECRAVRYSDLDVNGHMNNCRYLDWVMDLPGSAYHRDHALEEFSICYLSEVLEGDRVSLTWDLEGDCLRVDAMKEGTHRNFAATARFTEGS